jgi:hypothetical protein
MFGVWFLISSVTVSMTGLVLEPLFFLKAVHCSVFGAQILSRGCPNRSFFTVLPDVYIVVNV